MSWKFLVTQKIDENIIEIAFLRYTNCSKKPVFHMVSLFTF